MVLFLGLTLIGETPNSVVDGSIPETPSPRDVGLKLREALKQQLAIIHERVEAKKLAKLALAEVRQLLAKEKEETELDLGRKEITARVKERVANRLKEEEEKMEKEEIDKALEKVRNKKAKQNEKVEEAKKDGVGKKARKGGETVLGKEVKSEEKEKGKSTIKEKWKKMNAEKTIKGRNK
ncbi:hypothetical protein CHARACLAT_010032 [Characodon lateralis]|uniref:Uncharacterized protein n=1 Tax=Characodon lateralis TaxID=208331 RepID=A0ABU7F4Y2_9TELE|nr:hypothetical protein [Characodon lateralis]